MAWRIWRILEITVLIGLIGFVVSPHFFGSAVNYQTDSTSTRLEMLAVTLKLYQLEVGDCPSQEYGLNALIEKPDNVERWNGPYLGKHQIPSDSWGNALIYQQFKNGCSVLSLGADGKPGGSDDDADIQIIVSPP